MSAETRTRWSLDHYLRRIGYTGPCDPTEDVLASICDAHSRAVPFETLDAPEGRTPDLDIDSAFAKVVTERCGGACLEVNALLATALRQIGFTVDTVPGEAWRVLEQRYTGLPDHLVLLVRTGTRRWLVDQGFATLSPRLPVPLDAQREEDGWCFRVRAVDDASWASAVAERRGRDGNWAPLYRFDSAADTVTDFTPVRDHYLRVGARMRRTLLCARWTPRGRLTLLNDRLVTAAAGVETVRRVIDAHDAHDVLEEIFDGHRHLHARATAVWRRLYPPDRPAIQHDDRGGART